MYVISGANGHVGEVAAHALLKAGQKVRVIVHASNRRGRWENEGAEVVIGSVDDSEFLTQALRGATAYFALIPPNFSVKDYSAWQRVVADASVKAVKESGVPYVVLLSSVGADLEDGTGPIKGMHYFEEQLRSSGVKYCAIRPASFQENIGSVIGAAETAGIYPNFMSSEDFAMPMVATHDIGELVAEQLMNPPEQTEVVDLVGPSYSVKELAQKVSDALGKPVPIVNIPPQEHVKTLVDAGVPYNFSELLAQMHQATEEGKLQPCGDRVVYGKTPIDDVIHAMTVHHPH